MKETMKEINEENCKMIIEQESEHASTCLSRFHQSDFFVVSYGFLKYTTLTPLRVMNEQLN